MRVPLLTAVVSWSVALGCTTVHESLRDSQPYSSYVGSRFVTTSRFFLAREGTHYYLLPERKPGTPRLQAPSFEEFAAHKWRNRWTATIQYIGIVPEGAQVELVDVVRRQHMETGETITWYARIVSPDDLSTRYPLNLAGFFADDSRPAEMHGARRLWPAEPE